MISESRGQLATVHVRVIRLTYTALIPAGFSWSRRDAASPEALAGVSLA